MIRPVRRPRESGRRADGTTPKASLFRPVRALVLLVIAAALLMPAFNAEAAPSKLTFTSNTTATTTAAPASRVQPNRKGPRTRATPTPSATAAPTATVTPTAAPTVAPTATVTPTPMPTATPATTPTPTATVAPSATPVPTVGNAFVTRVGTSLYLNGQPFTFTGLNVYNANGRGNCAYALGTGSALATGLANATGTDVMRAWFFQYEATSNGQLDWSAFDHTLAVAQAAGVHVIATLADQWGACDGTTSRGRLTVDWYRSGYTVAPYAPGALLSYRAWVQAVVSHYRDNPTIMAWELMNEPAAPTDTTGACPDQNGSAAVLQTWASDMAGLVKGIDPNHLVGLGEQGSSQCGMTGANYAGLHVPGVDLCSEHDYGQPTTALTDGIRYDLATCSALGLPLFVGESGMTVTEAGSAAQRAAYLDSKFTGQLAAGVVGELVWDYCLDTPTSCNAASFDILPGDPTLAVIGSH
jgi:mannan endo-1,4-beta-mannosidase